MEPPSSPSSKKPKSHKSATFQLQDIHPSLNVNQDDDNDDAAGVSNNDDKVPTEPTMTPPTRFRPGTPAPSSRANSPHVKQKLHQMSMSDIDNDDDNKHAVVTGSKSAPVPSSHVEPPSHHTHHHHHHVHLGGKQQQGVAETGKVVVESAGNSKKVEHVHHHAKHAHFMASSTTASRNYREETKAVLAVVKGSVYIPTRTRSRPECNSFIETSDLGPPGADRRWLIDMKGFREDEITFFLDGTNLKVEGRQTTRPGKNSHHVETIVLPISYEIENLKVFRNKHIGTLVLAYLSTP
ncbi:hypothetical protein Fcan01_24808 [Folsomia candida]|uniref:SHSP domain-containing protein n=2 Tax=Folsomia candida TaxID=158441 RepID=A0A226D4K4_FOLCA|nr:hypothetical protein Fcan01_24808 [Folsomia candida]